ncbi:MAG: GatB/YqeY domain-containing protein [Patescibacteria group bacterium]
MTLLQRIEDDLLAAVKAQEPLARDVLRGVKSSLKNLAIEIAKADLSEEQVEGVIAKEVKRRKESIEAYINAGRQELVEIEQNELKVLEKYLPEQLDIKDVEKIIDSVIAELGKAANTGNVMGKLSGLFKGKADMGQIAKLVNEKLSRISHELNK